VVLGVAEMIFSVVVGTTIGVACAIAYWLGRWHERRWQEREWQEREIERGYDRKVRGW
jgi:membrane protein DedA with SNARE-associated domain